MRRLVATIAALSLLACTAAAAAAVRGGPPPPFPSFPGVWSHAEVNVKIKRVPHTLILDRGVITQISRQQLTLREADNSTVTIQLSPSTLYTIGKRKVAFFRIRVGMSAQTMVIDDGPAVRVQAAVRP